MVLDLNSRKERAEKQTDDVFHGDETDFAAGHPHEPGQAVWDGDQTDQWFVFVLFLHHQCQGEVETGDEGKWMGWIDCDRRQHGERLFHEIPFEPFQVRT